MQSKSSTAELPDEGLRHAAQCLLRTLASEAFVVDLNGGPISTFTAPVKRERRRRPPHEDFEPVATRIPEALQRFERPGRTEGFIYVATDNSGLFKIGVTGSPKERIQSALAWNLSLEFLVIWSTTDSYGVENRIHKAFAHRKRAREWFALTSEEAASFIGHGAVDTL